MNRREKIIVGLMLAAAVGATIDYLLTSSTASEVDGRSSANADIPAAISTASIEMTTLQLNPVRREMLENLDYPWRSDLLIQRETASENGDSDSGELTTPAFTAFFKINGKPLAIINGRDYAEGDWLDGDAFQIGKISPTQAQLKPRDGGEPMLIPIDPGSTR